MAWTVPMTAIAGSVFTAAQYNTFVRDNSNECSAAKATTAGSYFATTATNQIAERIPKEAYVATTETSASTSFTDLATPGPIVTVTHGPNVIVLLNTNQNSSAAGSASWAAIDVSGANTIAASNDRAVQLTSTAGQHAAAALLYTGLTAGTSTFTAKYRVTGTSTGTWSERHLAVIPF